jgi:predicted RNase H-like HicB family nuclease
MQEIGEAISLYLEEAAASGEAVPAPATHVTYIGVSAAA